jgi:roadblock/LC7 domain-containing protein
LASIERSGRFARRRYRQAYRSYIRSQWKVLLAGAALFLGVTAVVAILARGPLVRGLVIGCGVTATAAALTHLIVLASGAGPIMMGELAEQWTASELRRLTRIGWRVVNHFGLASGDIDHVVVGSPGVFVIETKWSASSWTENWAQADVEAAHLQAGRGARRMTMWENYKRLNLPPPQPLVVLWGTGSADLAQDLGRSDVITGSNLIGVLESQALINPQLTADQLDSVWKTLSEHLRTRDAREAVDSPMPASLEALALRLASGVVSGLASFVAAAYLLKAGLPLWGWFVVVIATVVLEHPARRAAAMRPLITGSQAGLVMTALLSAAVAGAQIVR